MNSINQQQAEDNYQDLRGTEAVDKLKALSDKAKNCFFCTNITTGAPFATRPMAIQQIDDDGTCWFLSATDSHTNAQIAEDPAVQLLLKGSDFSDFVTLYGHATVSQDKKKIHELWNPIFKTWFTEGEDDPRISVIQVRPVDAYYWDTKHGQIVGFAKQVIGAVTGRTLDDSIEGKLRL